MGTEKCSEADNRCGVWGAMERNLAGAAQHKRST